MDLSRASTEPLMAFVEFHDQFNRNIKVVSASLSFVDRMSALPAADKHLSQLIMKADVEPWGSVPWKGISSAAADAKDFISGLGIVRATSAFEDYVIRAWAELDRAGPRTDGVTATTGSADGAPALGTLASRLNVSLAAELLQVCDLFILARNCIVHRSNRASSRLETVRASDDLGDILKSWSKRGGKWKVDLPLVKRGEPVKWLPRHAIMASDCYYRLAKALDAGLVQTLGVDGLVHMATHWCFFGEPPVPTTAKLNTETVIRSQLMNRYGARKVVLGDMVSVLRKSGMWQKALAAFGKQQFIILPA